MKLTSKDGKVVVDVSEIGRKDDDLRIQAKIMGTMPMVIYLTPEELWTGAKLLNWQLIKFFPKFIYTGWKRQRKSRSKVGRKLV